MADRQLVQRGALLALCLVLTSGCLPSAGRGSTVTSAEGAILAVGPEIGNRAPEFTLESLGGQPVSLSDFSGRPVVINFFASWCAPCIKELPMLEAAQERERAGGLATLLIDLQEDRPTVQRFTNRLGLSAPVLLDTSAEVFYDKYRVPGLPATYFVDREGIIRARIFAELDEGRLESGLAAIRSQVGGFR